MDSARWDRIQSLFHDVVDRPPADRRALLAAACADDPTLVGDVLVLLEEDARTSLLDRDVAAIARDVVLPRRSLSLDPDQFHPYRLQRPLGEGGMGVVYLAERPDLGSLVAIKILRDGWLSPARRQRFLTEQRTLAQLNHPGIARLYDAHTLADGTPWFVMEYVDGVPLTEHCTSQRVSIADRLTLFRAVCEAVQYAHDRGIIHRDLKPSNILVKRDGTVRLLDFGIAKHLDPFDTSEASARTTMRLMTPAYASPEQVRGEAISVQSDVYSLGVILYELLTGELPFDASSVNATDGNTTREPTKPSATRLKASGVSTGSWSDLDVLCLTAMRADPARRYQSVEALIRDIDHFQKDEPLEARRDTLGYTATKFARRNWKVIAATAAIAAAVASVAVMLGMSLNRADAPISANTQQQNPEAYDLFL